MENASSPNANQDSTAQTPHLAHSAAQFAPQQLAPLVNHKLK